MPIISHGNHPISTLAQSLSKESLGLTQSALSQSQGLNMSKAASNAIKAYQDKTSKLEVELENIRQELEHVRSNKIVQNQILFEQQNQNALTQAQQRQIDSLQKEKERALLQNSQDKEHW